MIEAVALLALVAPPLWLMLWRGGVRIRAVLAPALAFGRAFRTVARQTVSEEFDRWFRPWPEFEPDTAPVPTSPWTRPREPVR